MCFSLCLCQVYTTVFNNSSGSFHFPSPLTSLIHFSVTFLIFFSFLFLFLLFTFLPAPHPHFFTANFHFHFQCPPSFSNLHFHQPRALPTVTNPRHSFFPLLPPRHHLNVPVRSPTFTSASNAALNVYFPLPLIIFDSHFHFLILNLFHTPSSLPPKPSLSVIGSDIGSEQKLADILSEGIFFVATVIKQISSQQTGKSSKFVNQQQKTKRLAISQLMKNSQCPPRQLPRVRKILSYSTTFPLHLSPNISAVAKLAVAEKQLSYT